MCQGTVTKDIIVHSSYICQYPTKSVSITGKMNSKG